MNTILAVRLGVSLLVGTLCLTVQGAGQPPTCAGASLRLTPDYRYLVGSAAYADAEGDGEAGSTFRWIRNGATLSAGLVGEGLLLSFDGTAAGANGEAPFSAANVQFRSGKWGSALALPSNGLLRFAVPNNLNLHQGTLELWVALREDIGAPLLGAYWQDPNFNPQERAFYYVRVLEIPTPRWTAYDAKFYGIQMPKEVPMTLQERAYTSPIWYTPGK